MTVLLRLIKKKKFHSNSSSNHRAIDFERCKHIMSKIIESLRVWIILKYSPRYPGKRWQHWIPSHYQWMRRRTDPGWQPLYWQRCLKEPEGERTKIRLSFMKTCCHFWGLNLTLISNVFKTKETDWNEKMFSDHWSALVFSHKVCSCSWSRH